MPESLKKFSEEVGDMKTAEELQSNDMVESIEVVVQSSVVIYSESVKNVCEAGKEFLQKTDNGEEAELGGHVQDPPPDGENQAKMLNYC